MRRGYLTAFAAIAACFAVPVQAQNMSACQPRAKVLELLEARYGETRQAIGLGGNNAVVEVFASLETGTWTITVTTTAGITCLVASGQAFEMLGERPAVKGDAL